MYIMVIFNFYTVALHKTRKRTGWALQLKSGVQLQTKYDVVACWELH